MPEDYILDEVRLGYLAPDPRDLASKRCIRCSLDFYSEAALHKHKTGSNRHNICSSCRLDFPTAFGLKDHYDQSPRHAYCPFCDLHFRCTEELYGHHYQVHHWCEGCEEVLYLRSPQKICGINHARKCRYSRPHRT